MLHSTCDSTNIFFASRESRVLDQTRKLCFKHNLQPAFRRTTNGERREDGERRTDNDERTVKNLPVCRVRNEPRTVNDEAKRSERTGGSDERRTDGRKRTKLGSILFIYGFWVRCHRLFLLFPGERREVRVREERRTNGEKERS